LNGWIGVDWGTSSLRGARFDENGAVIEERAFSRGILTVAKDAFGAVFDECFGDWMSPAGTRCLISGMAGSQQGWIEAPYLACPANLDGLADQLAWPDPKRIAIVPGMSCEHDGAPDVMRGEETQVFGALQVLGMTRGVFVLPGTHSKWVRVEGGRIEGFETLMTGEFYALLRKHSILSRTMPPEDGDPVESAFDLGAAHALRSPGLLQSAFSVRTLSLFERLPLHHRPSYLSGLVIGEEMRSRAMVGDETVVLIGDPALTHRYERVLGQRGVHTRSVGAPATWSGLWSIARRIPA
jgi:2-dehydro-3-deoxygalactonokinase